MATPHIAGAVALLWSAHPELRNDPDATEPVLNSNAVHILSNSCDSGSPTTPNNTFGNGRVDILAAVDAGGGDIVLTARQRVKGGKNQVQLTWDPADGGNVNVLRNSVVIRTVPDNGKANDSLGTMTGTFTYQVCETDSGDCSNEVDVTFP